MNVLTLRVLASIGILMLVGFLAVYVYNSGQLTVYHIHRDLGASPLGALTTSLSVYVTSDTNDALDVARAEWYQTLLVIDPVFGLPGADLDKVMQELNHFSLSRDYIVSLYSDQPESALELRNIFYPEAFWFALVNLEELRRKVLMAADEAAITEYHTQLLSVLDLHEQYVNAYRTYLEANPFEGSIGYWNGHSNPRQMDDAFSNLLQVAHSQLVISNQRYDCFMSWEEACAAVAIAKSDMQQWLNQAQLKTPQPLTELAIQEAQQNVQLLLDATPRSVSVEPVLYALNEPLCALSTDPQIFSVFLRTDTTFPHQRVDFAHNIYLRYTELARSPFQEYLRDRGMSYEIQALASYACSASGQLYGRVMNLQTVRHRLAAGTFFQDLGFDSEPVGVSEQVKHVLQAPVTTEVAVLALWDALLKEVHHSGTPEQKKRLYDNLVQYRYQTSTLGELLAWLANSNTQLNTLTHLTPQRELQRPIEMSLLRSYLSAFLSTFSWSGEPSLLHDYLQKMPNNQRNFRFVRYSDVADELSEEEFSAIVAELQILYGVGSFELDF